MLHDVDERTLYLLASKMVPYRLGPGTDLCSEGALASRLWILLEGGYGCGPSVWSLCAYYCLRQRVLST